MNRIQILRKENNLTQQDLAEKLGVSNKSISKYERGEREPDFNTLKKLSNIFNVSIDYLLGLSDNKNGENVNTNTDADIALLAKNLYELDGNSHLSKKQIELIKNLLMANKSFILSA